MVSVADLIPLKLELLPFTFAVGVEVVFVGGELEGCLGSIKNLL